MKIKPTIIDLFGGGGGFGLGAQMAGFNVALSVDLDPVLHSAYAQNFPNTVSLEADLSRVDKRFWQKHLGELEPDGVIGGPPCQGFSRIGAQREGDPRNSLIGHFFRHVMAIRPRFFVMENVEGILDGKHSDILKQAMQRVNGTYKMLPPTVVSAADFGAPTTRRRVFVVGFDPKRMSPLELSTVFKASAGGRVTVKDALAGLPKPLYGNLQAADFGWSRYREVSELSLCGARYIEQMRRPPPRGMGTDCAVQMLNNGLVSGVKGTKHSEDVKQRFCATKQGKVEPISRYPKLKWHGLCPTLRAGTGPEKGGFQSMRPIHPHSPRVITVREAARLQSFPDWYQFHPTKWHSFRMIGNSVPPQVAKVILKRITSAL